CGGSARKDHRLSSPRPRYRQDRVSIRGEGPERTGENPHTAADKDRAGLFALQKEHHLPPGRATDGYSPDRPDRLLRPLSTGEFPGSGAAFQGAPDRGDQFFPRSGGLGAAAGRGPPGGSGEPTGRWYAEVMVSWLLYRRG